MKRITLLILLFVFVSTASAEVVPLNALVDDALQNNPEIKAARQRWEASRAAVPQAGAFEDPLFSVMFDRIPDSSVNPGSSMERVYSITQEFPYPGKLSLMGKIADKEARMAYEEYKVKEKDIIREVKSAYFDLYMVQKSIDVNLETKEILHHLAKTAEARYATGLVSQWDVLRAQIELSQLANEIIILDQEKESVKARINRLLNRSVDAETGMSLASGEVKELPPVELLEAMAMEERPVLKGVERLIEREEAAKDLAGKGYYPDFMIRLGQREEDRSAAGWTAEFGVRVPLWFVSKQDNALKESLNRLGAAREEYQGMKNMVSFEIRDALAKVRSSKSLVNLHRSTHIPQAEQALKGARAGYETGKVDFLTIMESWKTVKAYKLEYHRSLAAYEQAWADLERAVGKELP